MANSWATINGRPYRWAVWLPERGTRCRGRTTTYTGGRVRSERCRAVIQRGGHFLRTAGGPYCPACGERWMNLELKILEQGHRPDPGTT